MINKGFFLYQNYNKEIVGSNSAMNSSITNCVALNPGFTAGTALGAWTFAVDRLPWLAGFNEPQNPTVE